MDQTSNKARSVLEKFESREVVQHQASLTQFIAFYIVIIIQIFLEQNGTSSHRFVEFLKVFSTRRHLDQRT
jgi:hypothetical protein